MNSFLDSAMPLTSALSKLCQSDEVGRGVLTAPVPSESVLKFKYVIIRASDIETAIIFPPFVQHNWAINQNARQPISAGFAWIEPHRKVVHVEGESVSLKLKSRPEDAEIIRETLFMNGL